MRIKASFFGPLRRPWPEMSKEIEIPDGSNVEALLSHLGYHQDEVRRIAVVVNGKRLNLSGKISEHDDVRLVLLAGGG